MDQGAVLKSNTEGNTPLRTSGAEGNFFRAGNCFCIADWAAQQQQLDVSKLLLDTFDDIDVMQKNAAGLCALDIAEDGGNAKLAALLLNHKSVDEEANKVTGTDDESATGAAAAAAAGTQSLGEAAAAQSK